MSARVADVNDIKNCKPLILLFDSRSMFIDVLQLQQSRKKKTLRDMAKITLKAINAFIEVEENSKPRHPL